MMTFDETGLPLSRDMFNAWQVFARTEPSDKNAEMVLRAAQILLQADPADTRTVAILIASQVPAGGAGILSRRFDENFAREAEEARAQTATQFAWLDEASDATRRIAGAMAIAQIGMFEESVEKTRALRAAAERYGAPGADALPFMPSAHFISNIAKYVPEMGAIGPAMLDKAVDYATKRIDLLATIGIYEDAELPFPALRDTGLPGDAAVRQAWFTVIADPRSTAETTARALKTALALAALYDGKEGDEGAYNIAAALIDIGVPGRNADDDKFYAARLYPGVNALLNEGNVLTATTDDAKPKDAMPKDAMRGQPQPFRRRLLAYAAVQLAEETAEAEQRIETLAKESIPAADFLKQSLVYMIERKAKAAEKLLPAAGLADRVLKQMLQSEIEAAETLVAIYKPKPLLMLPAPPAPKFDAGPGGIDL